MAWGQWSLEPPAVQCVVILSYQYVLVHGGIQIGMSVIKCVGDLGGCIHTLTEAPSRATLSNNLAPGGSVTRAATSKHSRRRSAKISGKPQTRAQSSTHAACAIAIACALTAYNTTGACTMT